MDFGLAISDDELSLALPSTEVTRWTSCDPVPYPSPSAIAYVQALLGFSVSVSARHNQRPTAISVFRVDENSDHDLASILLR